MGVYAISISSRSSTLLWDARFGAAACLRYMTLVRVIWAHTVQLSGIFRACSLWRSWFLVIDRAYPLMRIENDHGIYWKKWAENRARPFGTIQENLYLPAHRLGLYPHISSQNKDSGIYLSMHIQYPCFRIFYPGSEASLQYQCDAFFLHARKHSLPL